MASSSSSPSNYYEPSELRLGCPIFLSQSGSDKDFASFLEQALCNRGYRVFFDKEILPKAVPVSMANILGEAKNQCCKLGLLVLSDDFFEKTRNPMLELATFVEHDVDLLPLFYNLSVDEFKDESRRERWYEKWRTWVPEDVITEWKAALRKVGMVSGIEFCKEAPNRKMYIDIIVDKVCEILPIDLSQISEPFQGRKRLCKDWYSIAEAMMPNSPQLLSILLLQKKCRGTEIHNYYDYDQKAVLSRLLYDMIASSESDCYCRFGYGYPAVSCKETRIVSFLKPLLAAREVVTTLLQEFLNVPESKRWTITKTELQYDNHVLRGSKYKEEQQNLVLVGLVSIKMLNMSVDEGLADLMAQIVQSFVSRVKDEARGEAASVLLQVAGDASEGCSVQDGMGGKSGREVGGKLHDVQHLQ